MQRSSHVEDMAANSWQRRLGDHGQPRNSIGGGSPMCRPSAAVQDYPLTSRTDSWSIAVQRAENRHCLRSCLPRGRSPARQLRLAPRLFTIRVFERAGGPVNSLIRCRPQTTQINFRADWAIWQAVFTAVRSSPAEKNEAVESTLLYCEKNELRSGPVLTWRFLAACGGGSFCKRYWSREQPVGC